MLMRAEKRITAFFPVWPILPVPEQCADSGSLGQGVSVPERAFNLVPHVIPNLAGETSPWNPATCLWSDDAIAGGRADEERALDHLPVS
jgi:hypothetical protein